MRSQEENHVVVIMAGGAGTRFWPLSTGKKPKQFLTLFSDKSLLRLSYERIYGLVPPERVMVLTNRDFIPLVREQLPELPEENVIGEPCRRDTAAAVTLAALLCRKMHGNPVMTILTADHLIEPTDLFLKHVVSAVRFARRDNVLYTFGIVPDYPATGYGYLERGERVLEDDGIEHYNLLRFKEKPDIDTARRYVESGRFLWNSGMFVWSADAILGELRKHLPDHVEKISKAVSLHGGDRWNDALEEAFTPLAPVSIDFGVMEKASNVRCVAAAFSWNDVGSWPALREHLPADDASNTSNCRLVALDAGDNIVFSENPDDTVVVVGVNELVIARAGSRILVAHRDRTEDIKKLVAEKNLNK